MSGESCSTGRSLSGVATERATSSGAPGGLPSVGPKAGRWGRLHWRLRRLRSMSGAEVVHRVRQLAFANLEQRLLLGHAAPQPTGQHADVQWVVVAPDSVDASSYLARAEELLAGRWHVFGLEGVRLGFPPQWNRDPRSGITVPLTYARKIDYRIPDQVGDIRYTWELNRHLELVHLAQAYAISRDERYLNALGVLLDSWFDQCPYGRGANWISSMELAIRLINWSVVWQLIGGRESGLFAGREGNRRQQRWLEAVYWHAFATRHHLSAYSSANNHLIGEAAGLYIAATTWPCWRVAGRWQRKAAAILEREARRQTYEDGVIREQTSGYQQFVLQLLIVAGLAGTAAGDSFSAEYWGRVERMLVFLASITDGGGNVPTIGDSDDARALGLLGPGEFWRSLLAIGGVLLERPDLVQKAGGIDDSARWLLPLARCEALSRTETKRADLPRRAFPEGGYWVLGMNFETRREIRLIADAGALGYLSIAAHGHADALAMTLSVAGRPFLVDPGTYVYLRERRWREYFRGTAAHNTLRVDGLDQSVSGGEFMWLHKANAQLEHWESSAHADIWVGSHDGYRRLTDPVRHRRQIRLFKEERRVVVTDALECAADHDAELFWHFAEGCQVQLEGDAVVAKQGEVEVRLRVPGAHPGQLQLLCGSEDPAAGWVSPSFDVKRPSTTLLVRRRLSPGEELTTVILCSAPAGSCSHGRASP